MVHFDFMLGKKKAHLILRESGLREKQIYDMTALNIWQLRISMMPGESCSGDEAFGKNKKLWTNDKNKASAVPTPLDLNTLQPINVVPFLISSKILRILRGRGGI